MKFKITWQGKGGELQEPVMGEGDEYEGAITKALIKMLDGNIVTPGDSFEIEEIE